MPKIQKVLITPKHCYFLLQNKSPAYSHLNSAHGSLVVRAQTPSSPELLKELNKLATSTRNNNISQIAQPSFATVDDLTPLKKLLQGPSKPVFVVIKKENEKWIKEIDDKELEFDLICSLDAQSDKLYQEQKELHLKTMIEFDSNQQKLHSKMLALESIKSNYAPDTDLLSLYEETNAQIQQLLAINNNLSSKLSQLESGIKEFEANNKNTLLHPSDPQNLLTPNATDAIKNSAPVFLTVPRQLEVKPTTQPFLNSQITAPQGLLNAKLFAKINTLRTSQEPEDIAEYDTKVRLSA